MERRFKLARIESLTSTPTVNFTPDGKKMIITFGIRSSQVPEESGPFQLTSHRDIFERAGGSAFGSRLQASLSSAGSATMLTVSMNVNSKIPGTSTARLPRARKRIRS